MSNGLVNLNLLRQPWSGPVAEVAMKTGMATMGDFMVTMDPLAKIFYEELYMIADGTPTEYKGDPVSSLYLPVFDSFASDRTAVASQLAIIVWKRYFDDILPSIDDGILFVLNSCTNPYSYVVHGPQVEYLGVGDLHDTKFNSMKKIGNYLDVKSIADSTKEGLQFNKDYCPLEINVYPTNVRIFRTNMYS
jgi:hypothetical protein